jgi:hypothetical protein
MRLLTGLLILSVFVSGAMVGGGLLRLVGEPQPPGPGTLPPPLSELGLSPEQEARARAILDSHRPQIEAVMNDARPKLRSIHERVEAEVRAFLTDEQKRRLDLLKPSRRPPPLPMPGPPRGPEERGPE